MVYWQTSAVLYVSHSLSVLCIMMFASASVKGFKEVYSFTSHAKTVKDGDAYSYSQIKNESVKTAAGIMCESGKVEFCWRLPKRKNGRSFFPVTFVDLWSVKTGTGYFCSCLHNTKTCHCHLTASIQGVKAGWQCWCWHSRLMGSVLCARQLARRTVNVGTVAVLTKIAGNGKQLENLVIFFTYILSLYWSTVVLYSSISSSFDAPWMLQAGWKIHTCQHFWKSETNFVTILFCRTFSCVSVSAVLFKRNILEAEEVSFDL